MKKKEVSRTEMGDVKGGFNPVFSVEDSGMGVRAGHKSGECFVTYVTADCNTLMAPETCAP